MLPENTTLSGIIDKLLEGNTRLSNAINHQRAESELEEADISRDDLVRALFFLVTGYMYHPDPAIKNAAVTVHNVLESYGLTAVVNESYAVETSLIISMLADLAATGLQASIALLSGCAETITALTAAQAAFEDKYRVYQEEKVDDKEQDNATTVRKEVVAIINSELVDFLRSMVRYDEATFGTFTLMVDEIIKDNNEAVKRRRENPEQ